jgi:hypothetical protein
MWMTELEHLESEYKSYKTKREKLQRDSVSGGAKDSTKVKKVKKVLAVGK